MPAEKKKEYSLTYNFHIGNNLVHHKMWPLMLDKNGNVWLALCTISLAYNTANFNASIIHEKSHLSWKYDSDTESWKENIRTALSDNEKKVLAMSYAGMTIGQISKQLCKSVETIKKYRQSIFFKPFSPNPATGTVDFHQKW